MSVRVRAAFFSVTVVGAFFLMGAALLAQEKKNSADGVLPEVKTSIDGALKRAFPSETGGTRIQEAQTVWASVVAAVGFVVVFALAWFCVRVLALLAVVACFLGGIALVWFAVQDKWVTTWEQLAVLVLCVGAFAGVAAVTANLYLITGGIEGKS